MISFLSYLVGSFMFRSICDTVDAHLQNCSTFLVERITEALWIVQNIGFNRMRIVRFVGAMGIQVGEKFMLV